jgi:hypothetical protein
MAANLRRVHWISQSNLQLYNLFYYANNYKKVKLLLDIPFVTANRVAACGVLYPDTWPSYSTDYRYVVCDHSSKNDCIITPCGSLKLRY